MSRPEPDFSRNTGGDQALASRSCDLCAAGVHTECARAIGILDSDPFSMESAAWAQDTSTIAKPPHCLCFEIGHPDHPSIHGPSETASEAL